MAYTPIGWEDKPSTKTPVSAANLNKMDNQIKENADNISNNANNIASNTSKINSLQTNVDSNTKRIVNLEAKINNMYTDGYFGMIIHQDIANPSNNKVEYIGLNKDYQPFTMNLADHTWNAGSWGAMPTLAKNRPAMIKTDGTFDYWLDPSDYSKKADGVTDSDVSNTAYNGNAFSWFEPLWMRVKTNGNDLDVRFAYAPLDDDYIEVCPEHCGLWIPMFYGSPVSGKMRSIAGTKCIGGVTGNDTTDTQKSSISANGANYLFLGGKVMIAIALLRVLWSKSTNSDFWGLGNNSGYVEDSSKNYGTLSNPIVGGGQFYGSNDGKSGNKFLHSVALATYDVSLRDPYTLCVNGRFKVSTDYHYDVSGGTYKDTGIDAPVEGWQKTLAVADKFGLLPSTVGGSSTTYYCDYFWINKTITSVGLRLGRCYDGSQAGAFSLYSGNVAGDSWWDIGCAVMLKQSV